MTEFTVEQRTHVGLNLYLDVHQKHFKYAREIANGDGDTELAMAVYFSLHNDKYIDMSNRIKAAELLSQSSIQRVVKDVKEKARDYLRMQTVNIITSHPEGAQLLAVLALQQMEQHKLPERFEDLAMNKLRAERRQRQDEDRARNAAVTETRNAFNSQHKPAPEGTVKELAAKYGKSIGEIRKLKAANLLHTLEGAQHD
jgi:hypothetical protein